MADAAGVPPRSLQEFLSLFKSDEASLWDRLQRWVAARHGETLLLVAFSRWRIGRLFEDSKTELGLDQFEVRQYGAIIRHLLLTCVSHLFLAEFVHQRKKRPRANRVPGPDRHALAGAALTARRTLLPAEGRKDRGADVVVIRRLPSRPDAPEPWKHL